MPKAYETNKIHTRSELPLVSIIQSYHLHLLEVLLEALRVGAHGHALGGGGGALAHEQGGVQGRMDLHAGAGPLLRVGRGGAAHQIGVQHRQAALATRCYETYKVSSMQEC